MADLKISEMTDGPDVNDADLIPFVQAGANFKATKADFLTGGVLEDITIQARTGQAAKLQGTDIQTVVHCTDGVVGISAEDSIVIASATPTPNNALLIDVDGFEFTLSSPGVFVVKVTTVGAGVMGVGPGNIFFVRLFETVEIQLTDVDPGNWAGTPQWYHHAIDRLAAAVAGLLSAPVP